MWPHIGASIATGLIFASTVPPSPIAMWVGLCVVTLTAVVVHLLRRAIVDAESRG